MIKTVKVKELYDFLRTSNWKGYVESEAALIRMIRQMTEGRPAVSVSFHFVTHDCKQVTYKVNVKDLEN